jgi:hypothetical protein
VEIVKENHPAQPSPLLQAAQQRQRVSPGAFVLLIVMALLACGGGSGLAYYATVFHPAELHAQATTVAQAVLTAQSQSDIQATATENAMRPQELYDQTTSEKPMIDDPLSGPGPLIWPDYPHPHDPCVYTDGTYHTSVSTANVLSSTGNILYFTPCLAIQLNLSNFVFQAQMAIVSGDMGGLMFRANISSNIEGYLFGLHQNGSYSLINWGENNFQLLAQASSTALRKGLNQANLITVIARGSNIYLFVNRQYLGSVIDNAYHSGYIGMFVAESQKPTEVAFSHMQVWTF